MPERACSNSEKIQNPLTGRCVSPSSRTGKRVLFDLNNPKCKIHVFTKATPTFKRLVKKAEEQKSNFFRIFPWEDGIEDNSIMFVAVANDQICGWLSAKHRKGHLYISKISARSAMDKTAILFKGVGFALFERAKAYATDHNHHFISLFPINKRVSQIYERWGFQGDIPFKAPDPLNGGRTLIDKTSENMYYVLDKSKGLPLNRLHKHEPVHDIKDILEYLTGPQKAKMCVMRKENPDAFEEVVMHLQKLLDKHDDDKAIRVEFREYFKTV
jgi:GNAT superfamily N-acetyltransferase